MPTPFPHLPWVKNDAKATLYLPQTMAKPKQGFLVVDKHNEWSFSIGRSKSDNLLPLPNLLMLIDSMVLNKKINKGWQTSATVMAACQAKATSNLVAGMIINKRVSASNLKVLDAPHTIKPSIITSQ